MTFWAIIRGKSGCKIRSTIWRRSLRSCSHLRDALVGLITPKTCKAYPSLVTTSKTTLTSPKVTSKISKLEISSTSIKEMAVHPTKEQPNLKIYTRKKLSAECPKTRTMITKICTKSTIISLWVSSADLACPHLLRTKSYAHPSRMCTLVVFIKGPNQLMFSLAMTISKKWKKDVSRIELITCPIVS